MTKRSFHCQDCGLTYETYSPSRRFKRCEGAAFRTGTQPWEPEWIETHFAKEEAERITCNRCRYPIETMAERSVATGGVCGWCNGILRDMYLNLQGTVPLIGLLFAEIVWRRSRGLAEGLNPRMGNE